MNQTGIGDSLGDSLEMNSNGKDVSFVTADLHGYETIKIKDYDGVKKSKSLLSIKGMLFVTVLCSSFVTIGVGCFCCVVFFQTSILFSESERQISMDRLTSTVRSVMNQPQTTVDAMASAVLSGNFDFGASGEDGAFRYVDFIYRGTTNLYDSHALNLVAGLITTEDLSKSTVLLYYRKANWKLALKTFDNVTQSCYLQIGEQKTESVMGCELGGNTYENLDDISIAPVKEIYGRFDGNQYIREMFCPFIGKSINNFALFYNLGGSFIIQCRFYLCYVYTMYEHGGAIAMCLDTQSLSTYLKLSRVKGSFIYLFDIDTKNLVATSEGDKPFQSTGATSFNPYTVENTTNRLVKDVSAKLYAKHSNLTLELSSEEIYGDSLKSNYVNYARYNVEGLNYLIVVVTPMWNYLGRFYIFFIISIAVIVLGSLLTLVVGLCISVCVTKPLGVLQMEMQKVEKLDMNAIVRSFSSLREVKNLQTRFYYLLDILNEYVAFLPSYMKSSTATRHSDDFDSISGHDSGSESESASAGSEDSAPLHEYSMTSSVTGGGRGDPLQKFQLCWLEFDVVVVNVVWVTSEIPIKREDHGKISRFVTQGLRRLKGFLLSVHENRWEVVFGGFRTSLSPSYEAVKFVMKLLHAFESEFEIRFALSRAKTWCGVLGSEQTKFPSVSTSAGARVESEFLMGLHKTLKHDFTKVLCGRKFVETLENEIQGKDVDFTTFPVDIIVYPNKEDCEEIFNLIPVAKARSEEWMYVWKTLDDAKELTRVNEIWDALKENDFEKALVLLSGYKENLYFVKLKEKVSNLLHGNLTFQEHVTNATKSERARVKEFETRSPSILFL